MKFIVLIAIFAISTLHAGNDRFVKKQREAILTLNKKIVKQLNDGGYLDKYDGKIVNIKLLVLPKEDGEYDIKIIELSVKEIKKDNSNAIAIQAQISNKKIKILKKSDLKKAKKKKSKISEVP